VVSRGYSRVFREYPKCVSDFTTPKFTTCYEAKKKILRKKTFSESETFVLVRSYRSGIYGINTEISVLVESFQLWRTNEFSFVK